MIRFLIIVSIILFKLVTGFSTPENSTSQDPLVIHLDSLHHIDCLNSVGYAEVSASGGNPGYIFLWSDGATGPVRASLTAGSYQVEVKDEDGNSALLIIEIEQDFTPPVAIAGVDIQVSCSNEVVFLYGNGSVGPEFSYLWTASSGGRIRSGAQTLDPVIDRSGTFTLTVTNRDNGCTATDFVQVLADDVAPLAQATGGVLTCSSPSLMLQVIYTKTNTSFVWQGPGGFQSTQEKPVVSVAGNYVFTVTDTLTGCVEKSTAAVTSNFIQPSADATVSGIITCDQTSVQILGASNTPGVSYQWAGPNGYFSQNQSPWVSVAGNYTLTVQNPANGCTSTDGVMVIGNTIAPVPSAAVSGTLSCSVQMVQIFGSSNTPGVSYSWVGPNNFSSSSQSVSVSFSGVYTLTIKNPANGCTGSTSVTVNENYAMPNASAVGGTRTCASPMVNLIGQSTTPGVSYYWTGPNGFVSNVQNPSVSAVGLYTLKVTHPQSGCSAYANATVSQNTTPPSIWTSTTLITCANPTAKITTNSSPQGLQFLWSGPNNFSSTLQNPTVPQAGFYYVTATNPGNGCTNTTSVYVDANNTPPFAYAGEERSLNCNHSVVLINASFSSSGPNFTYQWTTWDGNIVSGATTLYPRVDLEGTYTLRVTNTQNGCTAFDSVMVVQRTPVQATITQLQPVHCSGGADGILRAAGGGGSLVYTYQWSNGATTATNSGLTAGTYTVTVNDSEGCTATRSIVLNELVLTAVVNVTHQTAPGINNGTASVSGVGGTSPYTVLWSTGATSFTIGGLAPGAYSVTLTDAKGCTVVRAANINAANCIMSGSVTGTNVTCAGQANGSATVQLANATNPVVYAWSNGATTKTANGLAAGTYSVTATDATGCKVILQVQISSPQVLITTITAQSNLLCPESSNGSITLGVSGGVQPYSFNWSNGAQGASAQNLSAGLYQATITDANSCSNTISAQISSPQAVVISLVGKTDVACPDDQTGSISVNVTGGQSPYQYFWSNGQSTANISALEAGLYKLTVNDQNGCQKQMEVNILINDQTPPQLLLKDAVVDLDANGQVTISPVLFDNGSFDNCGIAEWTVTPSQFQCGQTGYHTVTITATDIGGNIGTGTATLLVQDLIVPQLFCQQNIQVGFCQPVVHFNLPLVVDNCGFTPSQLQQVSGPVSGSVFPVGITTVSYHYSDLSGNIGQCSFDVTVSDPPDFQTVPQHVSCPDLCNGSLALVQLSGGPVQIQWSNGVGGFNNPNLCPGVYSATVTDAYQCTQTVSGEVEIKDLVAPQLSCPANQTVGYCQGPVWYNLPEINDNCAIIPSQLQLLNGLPPGATFPSGTSVQIYSYIDGNGNTAQCSFSVTVTAPPSVQASLQSPACFGLCNGTASLQLSGGGAPYSVQWSNGQTGMQATALCAGDYAYSIQDQNGCTLAGAVNLTQPQALHISLEQVQQDQGNQGTGSIEVQVAGGVMPYAYVWNRNGVFFAQTEHLSNLYAGQYALVVTDANGCTSGLGPVTITSLVSTAEEDLKMTVQLNPNPAGTEVWLEWPEALSENLLISIMDMNGKTVRALQQMVIGKSLRLDVSDIPQGLYQIQLSGIKGYTINRRLLIVR